MNKNYNLIDRFELPEKGAMKVNTPGIWFYLQIENKKYSVISLRRLNYNNPYKIEYGDKIWEAWEDGTDADRIQRFKSLKEMTEVLCQKQFLN